MRSTTKQTSTPKTRPTGPHADPLPVPEANSPTSQDAGDDWQPPTDTTGPRPLDGTRQALAASHVELAYRMAWRYFRHHFRDCPIDELIAEAMFGLTHAAAYYDEQRNIPFDMYAILVIRHRLVYAGLQWRRHRATFGSGLAPEDVSHIPAELMGDEETTLSLCDQIRATLPARWYDMLWQYCTEGLTMEQIGGRLGVSKQRAQKIIAKAMQRVRHRIDGWNSVC